MAQVGGRQVRGTGTGRMAQGGTGWVGVARGLALAGGLWLAGCGGPVATRSANVVPHPAPEPLTNTGTHSGLRGAESAGATPVQIAPPPAEVTPRTVELGRSVQGAPLTLEVYGDGPEVVFIFAGIHGSEPSGTALARQFAAYLRQHPAELTGRTVAILPAANPDGLAARTYGNARNVNLNRNFPAHNWRAASAQRRGPTNGPAPTSEPETQALMRALDLLQPQRIVSLHAIRRGQHCDNYDGPARELAERMALQNGYPVKANIGYPTPGSFGSWAGNDRGIPTVTLELPADASAAECWRDNAGALLAFVRGSGAAPMPPTAATGK